MNVNEGREKAVKWHRALRTAAVILLLISVSSVRVGKDPRRETAQNADTDSAAFVQQCLERIAPGTLDGKTDVNRRREGFWTLDKMNGFWGRKRENGTEKGTRHCFAPPLAGLGAGLTTR